MSYSTRVKSKQNGIVNANNDGGLIEDKLMKPFSSGWKREVVMRVVTDSTNCDIYYFHPNGKKLRSMTEVKANLTDGLTADCFTFKKKPLNVSSEIIRKAMVRGHQTKKTNTPKKLLKTNNHQAVVRKKEVKLKKSDNPRVQRNGTRRQILMKKIQQQRRILEMKKLIKSRHSNKAKNRQKVTDKDEKETKNFIKTPSRINRSDNRNKISSSMQYNGVSLKLGLGPSRERLKIDCIKPVRKYECTDIKSIVQRNIGKYRELRKKQIKEDLKERARRNISCEIMRRSKCSEPISKRLEIYLKPLQSGWRRELVRRVNGPDAAGRSDVYYFHPNGKKLRSTREVADNLTQGLTVDCFTFRKEPLGCGEPHEIIRNARLKKNIDSVINKKKNNV